MPAVIPLAYLFFLPQPSEFQNTSFPDAYDDESIEAPPTVPYTSLSTSADDLPHEDLTGVLLIPVSLSASDKWRLVKPLLSKYMLPLCELYLPFLTKHLPDRHL